ncbi:MAG: DUF790 family protein [Myxococcota bacterium]
MLTGDLLRARVKGKTLTPSLIDVTKPGLNTAAAELLAIWARALESRWKRGELDEAITAWIGPRRDHKVVKGLAKVLLDRSKFEVISPLPPVELRSRVFRAAREAGPLALDAGLLERSTADDVLSTVAAELGVTAQVIADALYSDLRDEERLVACEVPDPEWLLHRYNVALVQALLLRSSQVRLKLHKASTPRLRQLFRYVKFHQLMHLATKKGDWLEVVLDGPTSLFAQSSKYGMELATFFPAVLLQDGPWELDATVLWTKAKHRKTMVLTHEHGLKSHYTDRGAYQTREQANFEERWNAKDRDWSLKSGSKPIDLGGKAILVPDYTLRHPDGRVAHLEICGFWSFEALEKKLNLLARYGPGNVIVAVSRKRRGSKKKDIPAFDGPLIEFAEIVVPDKVVSAAEACACA